MERLMRLGTAVVRRCQSLCSCDSIINDLDELRVLFTSFSIEQVKAVDRKRKSSSAVWRLAVDEGFFELVDMFVANVVSHLELIKG